MSAKRILYCHCAYARAVPREVKGEVLRRLVDSGCDIDAVPDLCRLAARNDPRLEAIAKSGSARIAACYPRAVKWLFHAGGSPLPERGIEIFNMREESAGDVIRGLLWDDARGAGGEDSDAGSGRRRGAHSPAVLHEGERRAADSTEERFRRISALLENGIEVTRPADRTADEQPEAWKPWFPVIDYDRCTHCMQCLTFCLFDVYAVDEDKKIKVQHESNCKTDCPACSRVCPEVAILFPKYEKGPINGDVVRRDDVERESMKVDISALLGGDLYGSLRTRTEAARKRFSTERDASRALLERKRCLAKLRKDLDIPDEVLMTLPSADDIRERAERARAKRLKRQAHSQTVKDSRPAPTEDDWGI